MAAVWNLLTVRRVALMFLFSSWMSMAACDPMVQGDFGRKDYTPSPKDLVYRACHIPGTSVGAKAVANNTWTDCRSLDDMLHGEVSVEGGRWPILEGLGIAALRIEFAPCEELTPHNHPRATEMCVVLEGSVDVGLHDCSNSKVHMNHLEEGDITVFPQGLTHWIQNYETKKATLFCIKNSGDPGYGGIPEQLFRSKNPTPSVVLESAFGITPEQVRHLRDILPSDEVALQSSGCVPGRRPRARAEYQATL